MAAGFRVDVFLSRKPLMALVTFGRSPGAPPSWLWALLVVSKVQGERTARPMDQRSFGPKGSRSLYEGRHHSEDLTLVLLDYNRTVIPEVSCRKKLWTLFQPGIKGNFSLQLLRAYLKKSSYLTQANWIYCIQISCSILCMSSEVSKMGLTP